MAGKHFLLNFLTFLSFDLLARLFGMQEAESTVPGRGSPLHFAKLDKQIQATAPFPTPDISRYFSN